MRYVFAVLLVLALGSVVFWVPRTAVGPIPDSGSHERGRLEGLRAAEKDLAEGTPWLRKPLDGHFNIDGNLGIDRETGLPIWNTFLMCGTGVDFVAYRAEIEAYNERMLAARVAGELRLFRLDGKLRERETLLALFSRESHKYVTVGNTTITASNREYTIRTVETGRGEEWSFGLVDGESRLRPWIATKGPFHVLVADEETTLIVRDHENGFWVIYLPRLVVVQRLPAP